ncbi:MAG: folate family ECF transporter S component [Bacillota bacterium]|nr:folate family ECF transporter S component [Bacillota bacterium]
MKNNITKKIIIIAMTVAFDIAFSRVLALNVLTLKIGIGFAAIVLCAMLYGPVWAGVAAALSDVLGAVLFPTGAYFPGFTVTAALGGAIFGLFLYRRRPNFLRGFLAALCYGLCVTMLANTAMISFVYGPPFWPLFVTRLAEFGVMLALQTAVITVLSSSNTLYGEIMRLRNE